MAHNDLLAILNGLVPTTIAVVFSARLSVFTYNLLLESFIEFDGFFYLLILILILTIARNLGYI